MSPIVIPAPPSTDFAKPRVRLLLGTDEYISFERRVALVPQHLVVLRENLAAHDLEVDLLVYRGAGERASGDGHGGFPDDAYRAVGAEIVDEDSLANQPAVDVVHALKEPTEYESLLPGPFLRLGALHLASKPPGVCAMLGRRNFAGIFDGGTVGSCAYLLDGGDRTPIVASMSRFAGRVAARHVLDALADHHLGAGKVVVVGGGVAGRAAIETVKPLVSELVVVEKYEPMHGWLAGQLAAMGIENHDIRVDLDDDAVDGAIAIIFAHRSGAQAAEKVCNIDQIRMMEKAAAIADIAIDQGGSILHPEYDERDDAVAARSKYQRIFAELGYSYYAETNMPREAPHGASEHHGEASLAYVAVLLMLSALHGGPAEAVEVVRARPMAHYTEPAAVAALDPFSAHVQDLRNGLQLTLIHDDIEITDPDVRADEHMLRWVTGCAAGPAEQ